MTKNIASIIEKKDLLHHEIVMLLNSKNEDQQLLKQKADAITAKTSGNKVFYRGLIELSNICIKDCFYCGIRKSNIDIDRYELDEDAVFMAAMYAFKNEFGSIVLQTGERTDEKFIAKIDNILKKISAETNNKLGITLSLGEQTEQTYSRWFSSGAHRYLLRIETSNQELYKKLHPNNSLHSFDNRLKALQTIKKIGYQTGSGVMIGLPHQTIDDLANDLLFLKQLDIDMVGMGPYIEHEQTPLAHLKKSHWSLQERFDLSLNMISILRLMMPNINIAATTALQSIDPMGREKALKCGANIIMPNITPSENRKNYLLYDNKPCTDEGADDCVSCLNIRIGMAGKQTAKNEWGDSLHFSLKQKNTNNL